MYIEEDGKHHGVVLNKIVPLMKAIFLRNAEVANCTS